MSGKKVAGISDSVMEETYVRNLIYAANMLEPEEMIGLIEPINKYTGPNYFLDDFNKGLHFSSKFFPLFIFSCRYSHLRHNCIPKQMQTL